MATLAEMMTRPPARARIVAECVTMIDEEVADKSGLTGLALKGAYSVVKAVKPRFIGEVVDALLDEWVGLLEPLYAEWQNGDRKQPLAEYLSSRQGAVAEKLLGVTDTRVQSAKNANVKKLYEKLRPTAKKHVEMAVPRLARLIARHAAT